MNLNFVITFGKYYIYNCKKNGMTLDSYSCQDMTITEHVMQEKSRVCDKIVGVVS